ncbi:hypothetical protein ACQKMZ_25910 [Bacillus paramycoides]|uniref:hypothetical protein n=1 Tax=Bacillus paramycoides TaxID=2026194 RepID=UPI003D095083
MKYCSNCGNANDDGNKFCGDCGQAFVQKEKEESYKDPKDIKSKTADISFSFSKKEWIVISILGFLVLAYFVGDMAWRKHEERVAREERVQLEAKEKKKRDAENKILVDAEKKSKFVVDKLKKDLVGLVDVIYDRETKTIKVARYDEMEDPNKLAAVDVNNFVNDYFKIAKDLKEKAPEHSYKIECFYKNDPENKYFIISDGQLIGGKIFSYMAKQSVNNVYSSGNENSGKSQDKPIVKNNDKEKSNDEGTKSDRPANAGEDAGKVSPSISKLTNQFVGEWVVKDSPEGRVPRGFSYTKDSRHIKFNDDVEAIDVSIVSAEKNAEGNVVIKVYDPNYGTDYKTLTLKYKDKNTMLFMNDSTYDPLGEGFRTFIRK